jgi:pimeloyl-ACP methyl ester carboxylesterase
MAHFRYQGQSLAYEVYGEGNRPFILLHGQLLSQRMHERLAASLADQGNRVITLDLLGHGASSRPRDMWRYSMEQFADQVVALMDHLELRQAVVGGTSLGANVSLEFAVSAPERARGLVVEMPVLDHGVYWAVVMFTPLLTSFMYGMPVVNLVSRLARLLPRDRFSVLGQIAVDVLAQDHSSSAAVLQGLFFGRAAPTRSQRQAIQAPSLVIGHPGEPLHPLKDAAMLASELGNSRLIQAESIYELRVKPERLTAEIATFLDQCWQPQAVPARRTRRAGRRKSA